MKKTLVILGLLLTLANNASSSGASQHIPPEPDNIIFSPKKKGEKESKALDKIFAQNKPVDSPEWQGQEIMVPVAKNPYWANGKPLLLEENTEALKGLNDSERVKQNNRQRENDKLANQMNILKDPENSHLFGPASRWKEVGREVVSLLGADYNKSMTTYRVFAKSIMKMLVRQLMLQKGPQIEGDVVRMKQTLPRLENTVLANKYILALKMAVNNRAIEKAKFLDNYRLQHGGISRGFKTAWYNSAEAKKSIFQVMAKTDLSMVRELVKEKILTGAEGLNDSERVKQNNRQRENDKLANQMNILKDPENSHLFGPASRWKEVGREVVSLLGADYNKSMTTYRVFAKSIMKMLVRQLMLQKGPQIEGDVVRMKQTLPRLENTVLANKYILALKMAVNNRAIEKAKFLDNYRLQHGGISRGFKTAWYNSAEAKKSIFQVMAKTDLSMVRELVKEKILTGPEITKILDSYKKKESHKKKFSVNRNLFRILQKSILLTRNIEKISHQISHQGFLFCALCERLNPKEKNQKKDETYIVADHVKHDVKKENMWARGRVKIRTETKTIHADKVKLNNKTGDGEARGHVIIKSIDGTKLKSNISRFNIKSQKTKLLQTQGRLGEKYYIKSRELSRHSKKHFTAKYGSLTTCTGKLPAWSIDTKWADIVRGDRAIYTGGVLKVRDIPIFYVPIGFIPMDEVRKTGFLAPEHGYNDVGGIKFDNSFFWAINEYSDATFKLGYQGRRGFTPEFEYRYTPSKGTNGTVTGKIIDDKITHDTYWKLDAAHRQALPKEWQFNGVLDLEGKEYNKTFTGDTNLRNRRISLSYATLRKRWESSSLEVLTRYRISVDGSNDGTHGELPQISYISQTQPIGESEFYFSHNTVFTSIYKDLNSNPDVDRYFSIQKLDLNQKLTRSINIAPWLNFASSIGLRETLYSKGQNTAGGTVGYFSREGLDFNANIRGPTFEKVYQTDNKLAPKFKHLLEPRLNFSYVPELDVDDSNKIHPTISDPIIPTSVLSYSLIQRVLKKEKNNKGDFYTREAARFIMSQSYNLREAQRVGTAASPSRPFSDIRFDLDSRPVDALLINVDSNFDYNNNVFTNWNWQVGFRPVDEFTLYFERRWNRRGDITSVATLDWDFKKWWNLKASTRLDELTDTHRENNLSLLYDDPCKCWGFNIDYIHRNNFNPTSNVGGTKEKIWLFSFTFRGLGSFDSKRKEQFIHRSFDPLHPSEKYLRRKREEQRRRGGQ